MPKSTSIAGCCGHIHSVTADFYTAMAGLGALLQVYGNSFRMDQYFVVTRIRMCRVRQGGAE